MADHVADIATDLYGKDLIDIAGWLHVPSSRYAALVRNISKRIVASVIPSGAIGKKPGRRMEPRNLSEPHGKAVYSIQVYAEPTVYHWFRFLLYT